MLHLFCCSLLVVSQISPPSLPHTVPGIPARADSLHSEVPPLSGLLPAWGRGNIVPTRVFKNNKMCLQAHSWVVPVPFVGWSLLLSLHGKEEYMEYMSNIIWGYYLEIIFYPKPQCQGGGKQCLGNSGDARCSASPGTAGEELCFIHFSWKSGVPRGFGAGCSCGVQTDPRLLLLAGTSVNCFSRFLGFQLGWEPSSRWETILKAHRWCFGTH